MLGKNLIKAAAAKAQPLYIEDVMSTWLHTGNGSTQTITNGIDLAGEGGLVWIKGRSYGPSHALFDTARGVLKILSTDSTSGEGTSSSYVTSFNSTGFSMGSGGGVINSSLQTYASWTFRKAPKFFDVVTYTGTGGPRTVAHNLGSVPGFIIIKSTSLLSDWRCYHRSLGATQYIGLNLTNAAASASVVWNNTAPTSTEFTVGIDGGVNSTGQTYVAYLFAHDAGGFGDDGTESVIKCGSHSTTSGSVTTVDLGWEPQWLLWKVASSSGFNWYLVDNMRGFNPSGVAGNRLLADSSNAEAALLAASINLTSTGFTVDGTWAGTNSSCVYIAIRRGPMKTPTSGAEVFGAQTANQAGTGLYVDIGAPLDALWLGNKAGSANNAIVRQRLTASNYLVTSSTAAEAALSAPLWQTMQGVGGGSVGTDTNSIGWGFRRAPGFFDVVAYTGNSVSGGRTVAHNLGSVPGCVIIKRTDGAGNWLVHHRGTSGGITGNRLYLNTTAAQVSSGINANATTITLYNSLGEDNIPGAAYIAYLFATCPGVSKCFSFTGNGTSQTIDCGFASGARFVLLKRTDSTGNWLVADTARGIISGNDPLLYLNRTAAEITTLDWIDPDSSGFIVNQEATANANVSGATYVGIAIA